MHIALFKVSTFGVMCECVLGPSARTSTSQLLCDEDVIHTKVCVWLQKNKTKNNFQWERDGEERVERQELMLSYYW